MTRCLGHKGLLAWEERGVGRGLGISFPGSGSLFKEGAELQGSAAWGKTRKEAVFPPTLPVFCLVCVVRVCSSFAGHGCRSS